MTENEKESTLWVNSIDDPLDQYLIDTIKNEFKIKYPEWVWFFEQNISDVCILNVLTLRTFFSDVHNAMFTIPTFPHHVQNKKFWATFLFFINQHEEEPLSDLDQEHILQVIMS